MDIETVVSASITSLTITTTTTKGAKRSNVLAACLSLWLTRVLSYSYWSVPRCCCCCCRQRCFKWQAL